MALVVKDRVKQTTTTTGTGSIVLNGNVSGFQTFAAALTDGDTTYYGIFEPSTNEYEVGLGTWTESTATLARTTVLESSNSGSAVSLTAQAEVFITQPAEKAVYLNSSDVAELGNGLKVDSSSGSITITAEDGSGNIDVNLPRDNISPLSTITVTVANPGSGNKYYLDGALQQTAILKPSVTYRFDQSDSSNSGHPLRFSTTSDGTHGGGSEFTTGVTTSGTAGSAGAYTEVRFEQDVAAKLYYYCSVHSGMGGAAETKSISTTGGTFTGAVTGTDLTLSGDLTVNGTTTTVNTTNMVVSDALIELANGTTGTPANDAGLVIERGDSNNAFIGFDESADKFIVGASTGDLTITTGTLVANVEGNVTGNVTGNADTATTLATGRTISLTGDVTGTSGSFDGSGNVSITTTIGANSVALGTDTTGNYVGAGATSGNGISGSVSSEGGTFTVTSNATNANTGNTIVYRDASGNFSAGTITASLSGNATTATNVSGYSGTYWTSNNDGAGSGLDADLWDGNQFSSYLNQAVLTTSDVTFNEVYNNNWFRNNQSGEGLYNQATGAHWASDSAAEWTARSSSSHSRINLKTNGTSHRGSLYATSSNEIGLLDSDSSWAMKHTRDSRTEWFINGTEYMELNSEGLFLHDGSLAEDYDALSGTTPTCNVDNGGAFSLTMTGNTTFTFSGAASGYIQGFVLQLTGNGSTVTWPGSVKWAGGTAPDAPASGETDILVFHTRDGGTNWYGVLASDAAA
jgi:hypothetical protein